MKKIEKFLSRQPFVLLGAFGLLSLIDNIKDIPSYIGQWIDAWQLITRGVWEYLIGWLFDVHWLFSDYLTMGVIVLGALIRCVLHINYKDSFIVKKSNGKIDCIRTAIIIFPRLFLVIILWPFCLKIASYIERTRNNSKDTVYIFYESFVYALVLIGVAYAILFFENL